MRVYPSVTPINTGVGVVIFRSVVNNLSTKHSFYLENTYISVVKTLRCISESPKTNGVMPIITW